MGHTFDYSWRMWRLPHTQKMGLMGPEDDSTLMLSGHPAQMPLPDIDRGILESKGMAATQTLTFWIGP